MAGRLHTFLRGSMRLCMTLTFWCYKKWLVLQHLEVTGPSDGLQRVELTEDLDLGACLVFGARDVESHLSCGFFSEDLSLLNVEIIPLGYPEMGLGLWARKDAEGFAEAMWLRKVPRKV